jgi:NTP pyrophosphatase (non-canonical NTP hydrolase)
MDLSSYQRLANLTDQRPGTDEHALSFPLLGLASEVGSLVNQFKKRLRDGEAHELFAIKAADKLGDILWYVANLSEKLGYSLQDIADRNLQRVNERWSTEAADRPALLLDDRFPSAEQLPRQVKVKFEEVGVSDGQGRVVISSGGERLGDPLSDMAWDDDDYRYHDAFHLTYAAVLGWSPITRSFFRRQRESDPRYREVEDSGRAKVIEEAIAALTFDYARDKHYLEGVQSIDSALLETVVRMASGFEVRIRTARNWEQAILRSFEIWRGLRRFRGGIVQLDLPERTIELVSRTTPAVADETARPQPQEAPRTSGSPRP